MVVDSKDAENVTVDLFVRVPSSVTAPVTYTLVEVDAINQVANGRERGKRVTFNCKGRRDSMTRVRR